MRQAINYALDREALLDAVGGGYGSVTTQVFPTFSTSYDEELDSFYEYDLDKAKELMAEAGYADGFAVTMPRAVGRPAGGLHPVRRPAGPDRHQRHLRGPAGRRLHHRHPGAAVPDVVVPCCSRTRPTSSSRSSRSRESATWNLFHVADPTVDELIEQLRTGDEATAEQAGQELNRYVVENAFFAPFYRPQNTKAVDAGAPTS